MSDFRVTDYGTVVYFTPQTEGAKALSDTVGLEPWQRLGNSFALDHRPAQLFIDQLQTEGYTFGS